MPAVSDERGKPQLRLSRELMHPGWHSESDRAETRWPRLYLGGTQYRPLRAAVRLRLELALPAADLERAIVVRVLDRLSTDGRTAMASRTAAYGRACYQWAVKRGALQATHSPIYRLRPSPNASAYLSTPRPARKMASPTSFRLRPGRVRSCEASHGKRVATLYSRASAVRSMGSARPRNSWTGRAALRAGGCTTFAGLWRPGCKSSRRRSRSPRPS